MKKDLILCIIVFCAACITAGAQTDRMSLEEKAKCVVGWKREFFPDTNKGICARTVPFPEYGIPTIALADGTSGLRLSRRESDRSTAFPANIALASSWDTALSREVGAAAGYEARGYNINVLLAPGVNIMRNPLCGRNFEYFSEDPVITGKMGAAYVAGVQSNGVATSVKHFSCNNQETNRSHVNTMVSERALREIYLRGFEICVKESSPWTVMTSYNDLNGVPMQENWRVISGILRNEWGFDGLCMTDWSISKHNTAAQLHAGNDLYMPGCDDQVEDIIKGVNDGTIDIEDLNRACRNVVKLGQRCYFTTPGQAPDLNLGAAVSRKAACESAVLLENRGMLPLPAGGSAAVFGVRSYDLVATGNGSAYVTCAHISQINEALKEAGTAVDAKLEDLYKKYVSFARADFDYNEKSDISIGKPLLPELEISRKLVEAAAESNDYAIITLGRTSNEGEDRVLEGDYYLNDTEKNLIKDVCELFHAKGKKVVVVLNICGIIEMQSWKDMPDAILNAWLPGQEGGAAICDLLSGRKNPCGKLAVSIPVDYFDLPSAYDFPYDQPKQGRNRDFTEYKEGIYVGYRYFCTKGLKLSYPFGYGLSYTTFDYSGLRVKAGSSKVSVSVTVTNSGSVAGKEAVGVYVSAPAGGLDKPAWELKAFAKTGELQPGESETVRMEIPASWLASYDEAAATWKRARGKYKLRIGPDVTSPAIVSGFNGK